MKITAYILAMMTAFSLTACSFGSAQTDSAPAETSVTGTESTTADSISDADDELSAAFGKWEYELDGCPQTIIVKGRKEAYICTSTDITEDFCFDESKQFYWSGKKVPKKDYSFEDGVFILASKDRTILSMKKLFDFDDIFGEYQMTGGEYMKMFTEDEQISTVIEGDDCIKVTVSPDKTLFFLTMRQDGFELTKERFTITRDGELIEGSVYQIDGDTMTLTSDDGDSQVLTRVE